MINKHNCKILNTGIEIFQMGLSTLVMRIPNDYDGSDCRCDEHYYDEIEISFCPVCGYKNPYPSNKPNETL